MNVLASHNQPTVADFGHDVWWIVLIKIVGVFVLLVLMTLFAIVLERKVVARMQQRLGPNRVGPGGWLQSLADGLKLAFKEDIMPALADRPVYFLAPVISAVPAFLAFSVTFPIFRSRPVSHDAPGVARRPCATSRSSREHNELSSKLVCDPHGNESNRDRRRRRRPLRCRRRGRPYSKLGRAPRLRGR